MKNLKALVIVVSFVFLSCESKTSHQKSPINLTHDSIIVDTLVQKYNAIVVTYKNNKTGKYDDLNLWVRFPESLTFQNFNSTNSAFSKSTSPKLNFDFLELEKWSLERKTALLDSLIKKNNEIKKPNFNRRYKILTTEVDGDCCGHFLVDLSTGKVTLILFSLWGAEFREDSYLLILNPIDGLYKYHDYKKSEYEIEGYFPATSIFRGPEAYLFIGDEFKRVF